MSKCKQPKPQFKKYSPQTRNTKISGISYIGVLSAALWRDISHTLWGLYSFELNSLRAFFRWWESVDGELFKWLRCVACRQRLMIKLMAGWHPNKPAVTYPRVTCNKKINNIIGNEYFSFKIKVTPILESCIANPKALLNSLGLSLLSFTYDESGNNNFSRTWLYYSLRKLTYAHKNPEKNWTVWATVNFLQTNQMRSAKLHDVADYDVAG